MRQRAFRQRDNVRTGRQKAFRERDNVPTGNRQEVRGIHARQRDKKMRQRDIPLGFQDIRMSNLTDRASVPRLHMSRKKRKKELTGQRNYMELLLCSAFFPFLKGNLVY